MLIRDLVTHYRKVKSLHAPISASLADKVAHIERVFGDMGADAFGYEYVESANDEWNTASAGTIRRYLVQLRAILSRGVRDGLIDKMPAIDLPYVNDTVHVDISGSEMKMMLDYIQWTEPKWYPLALVLSHTGARLSEALRLDETSFSARGSRIAKPVGRRTKTIDRVIPFTPRMKDAHDKGLLLHLLPKGISEASASTCLGRVVDASTKALGLPPMRVHDLRHAFAAMLAEQGADLADLVAALGHSSTAMSMRYRGLVRGRLTGIMANV